MPRLKATGLFQTRLEAKKSTGPRHQPQRPVSLDAVRGMNPNASTPMMEPSGATKPSLYVLGECPGRQEDQRGVAFVGSTGRFLFSALEDAGVSEDEVRRNNVCRTYPKDNRDPTAHEIECFRQSVQEDIERYKPAVVLAVGRLALAWAVPGTGVVELNRGRAYPVRVGKHVCWWVPVQHPSYIMRLQNSDKRKEQEKGRELERIFDKDIKQAVKLAKGKAPQLQDTTEEKLTSGVTCYTGNKSGELKKLLAHLRELSKLRGISVDLETTHLRPFSKGSEILSVAVGSHQNVASFAYLHKEAGWTATQLKQISDALLKCMRKVRHVVFQNAVFDVEWLTNKLYGFEFMDGRVHFHDTLYEAFTLDERTHKSASYHSLDYLCLLHFGFRLKEYSDVDRAKLKDARLDSVLRYGGMDPKFTYKLHLKQKRLLKQQNLISYLRDYERRIPALVASQSMGFPASTDAIRGLHRDFEKLRMDLNRELREDPHIKQFAKLYGKAFSNTPQDVVKLVSNVMKHKLPDSCNGKWSSRAEVLEELPKTPAIDSILKYRQVEKALGTYIRRLMPDAEDTYVYPDHHIHPSYKAAYVITGRLSCEDPNAQNYPKRKSLLKRLRSSFVAPPGHTIISIDFGQLEYRTFGIVARDETVIQSCYDGFDVHMAWAERLYAIDPKPYKRVTKQRGWTEAGAKAYRAFIKNKLVFPAFYGANKRYLADLNFMPQRTFYPAYDEFRDQFAGIFQFQEDTVRMYHELGYVYSMSGRRQRAPLEKNKIINYRIQGTASDIVVDAMVRLTDYAIETGQHYYIPRLNIHDDLTFVVPDEMLEEVLPTLIEYMLRPSYEWAKAVPMLVEVEMGKDWEHMEFFDKYEAHTYLEAV